MYICIIFNENILLLRCCNDSYLIHGARNDITCQPNPIAIASDNQTISGVDEIGTIQCNSRFEEKQLFHPIWKQGHTWHYGNLTDDNNVLMLKFPPTPSHLPQSSKKQHRNLSIPINSGKYCVRNMKYNGRISILLQNEIKYNK